MREYKIEVKQLKLSIFVTVATLIWHLLIQALCDVLTDVVVDALFRFIELKPTHALLKSVYEEKQPMIITTNTHLGTRLAQKVNINPV